MSNLPKVSVSSLLDAGIHFGHKTSRWNPKMAPYIYGVRDDVHIIDLQQTVPLLQNALQKIYDVVKHNGKVLFVSSKVQAADLIAEYAEKCGQFYINNRWLGGTLTNWGTISKSIKKLSSIEKILEDEEQIAGFTKKEILDLNRQKEKLLRSFAGIRNIGGRPDLIIVIDTNKEHLAINEATKLDVPIVAVVDSNSNPDGITYPIPGNDDAIRSIKLYCSLFADAALAGIQDSLADSGVDVGLAKNVESKDLDGVVKIEKVAKVSKATTVAAEKIEKKAAPKAKKSEAPKEEKAPAKKTATKTEKEGVAAKKTTAKTADKKKTSK